MTNQIKLPDTWKDWDEIDLEDHKCRRWGEFCAMVNEFIEDTEKEKGYYENVPSDASST